MAFNANNLVSNSIDDWSSQWIDDPEWHRFVHESFTSLVTADDSLNSHRTFVEQNHWGLGERSFGWLWNLLVREMLTHFRFLEIGVHRGQITSLVGMLAEKMDKLSLVFGVSPFNGHAMGIEGNFIADACFIWDKFVGDAHEFSAMAFSVGLSADAECIQDAQAAGPYEMVYIDGDHSYEAVKEDLKNYMPMVKVGGYLLTDDSANSFHMPWGYFQGIDSCSKAVDEVLPPTVIRDDWLHVFNVMHLRCFKRIK